MFEKLLSNNLIWFPATGFGYYPVDAFIYDEDYYQTYAGYCNTEMGRLLNKARVEFVNRHYTGELVDVGIGAGQFIEARGKARGYDVNPAGKTWLKNHGLWCDIYAGKGYVALTFWDSLEHIKDIEKVVQLAHQYVFLSMPIYKECYHVLKSKHFKPAEHFWYFTHAGIIKWMDSQGFDMIEHNTIEQGFGREDIGSYAFWRRNA